MASNSPSRSADVADRPRLNIREVARAGRLYSLAVDRFPGMPLFPGHPPFQVLTYRSPQGLRISGARPWGPGMTPGSAICANTFYRPPIPARISTPSPT